MNAWRIEKHHLGIRIVPDAEDPVPGCLWLVRHDGQLRADEPVEQRRFAGIRATDERDEPGFHVRRFHRSFFPVCPWCPLWNQISLAGSISSVGAILLMRTLVIRRRSASSTSTASPSISN